MHVDPIQTCFGFVIDRSCVLKAIYLKLLSIVVLASDKVFLHRSTVFARLENPDMQSGNRRRKLCLVMASVVKGAI